MFAGQFVKGLDGQIQQRAREKLKYLDSAADLRDLMIPPARQAHAARLPRRDARGGGGDRSQSTLDPAGIGCELTE